MTKTKSATESKPADQHLNNAEARNKSRQEQQNIDQRFTIRRGGSITENKTRDEIRNFVQSILQRSVNISTLIGSGASKDAIPLMSTTLHTYSEDNEAHEDNGTAETLESIQEELGKEKDNIEEIFTLLGQKIEANADPDELYKTLRDDLLKAFLDSIYSAYEKTNNQDSGKTNNQNDKEHNHDKVLENYIRVISGLGRSRQILARQQQTTFDIVNLFTTNYDLFHEEALEQSRYVYTDGFSNGLSNVFSTREFHRRPIDLDDRFRDHLQPINPFFRLVKLHGSINWTKDDNEKVIHRVSVDLKNGSSLLKEGDKSNVLIAPTKSKFALTQDLPYSDLFREFVNCLAIPNSVLFVTGFGFGDSHISNLIESALDRTDFTLYVFSEDPEKDNRGLHEFYSKVKSSPNAYFISPICDSDSKSTAKDTSTDTKTSNDNATSNDSNTSTSDETNTKNKYLTFEDFAYFMQPSIDTHSLENVSEER